MDREELIQKVEMAFSGVTLGEGIGILEAEAIDNCVSDKKRTKARNRDIRHDWTQIPDEIIDNYYSALSFMDNAGLRYCLPAYMRFALRFYDASASASVDMAIYALDNSAIGKDKEFNIFSEQQRKVIAQFLRFMVTEAGEYWVDAGEASRAYEKYWEIDDN